MAPGPRKGVLARARHAYVWSIEIKHGALWPEDRPGALGLLFGIDDDDGERIAVVTDPDWLRMLLGAMDAGADMARLPVPREVMLPIAATGWDDDWGVEERAEMDHMLWLFTQAEHDWVRFRAAVDAVTGYCR